MSVHIILDINPEPWTSPDVAVGRKGGKAFPIVYSSAALKAYKNAIRESLEADPVEHDIRLHFYLWRQLPIYENERQRKVRKHEADATNLQKALEDALQGVLFKNDRQVKSAHTDIMEQAHGTRPMIVVQIHPWEEPPELEPEVQAALDDLIKATEKVVMPRERNFDPKDVF